MDRGTARQGSGRRSPQQEAALARRLRQGDPEALEELYERYVDRLYRHAYYFVRERETAEQVTLQALLEAWERLSRGGPRARLLPWLLGIVHELAAASLGEAGPAAVEARTGEVLAAILRLPAAERLVLTLRFVDGLSYQEAAEQLGRSLPSLLSLQYRALSRLRRLLPAGRGAQPEAGL